MTKEEIKQHLEMNPFVPFTVKVAGGDEYKVPSRDHAHLHPRGRVMTVFIYEGGTVVLDVALISSIFIQEAA